MAVYQCATCSKVFNENDTIIKLNSFGSGPCLSNIKIITKLLLCVPEIVLEESEKNICAPCCEMLEECYTFRIMCVKKQYFKNSMKRVELTMHNVTRIQKRKAPASQKDSPPKKIVVNSVISTFNSEKKFFVRNNHNPSRNKTNVLSKGNAKEKFNSSKILRKDDGENLNLKSECMKYESEDEECNETLLTIKREIDIGPTRITSTQQFDNDLVSPNVLDFDSDDAVYDSDLTLSDFSDSDSELSAFVPTDNKMLNKILANNPYLQNYKPDMFNCSVILEYLPEKYIKTPLKNRELKHNCLCKLNAYNSISCKNAINETYYNNFSYIDEIAKDCVKNLYCILCSKAFSSGVIKTHMDHHCRICLIHYGQITKHFPVHKLSCISRDKFFCNICKHFAPLEHFYSHLPLLQEYDRDDDNTVQCTKCYKFFKNKVGLSIHFKKVHLKVKKQYKKKNKINACGNKYKCSTCDLKFSQQSKFDSHECFKSVESIEDNRCQTCNAVIKKDSSHFCGNLKNVEVKQCAICLKQITVREFASHIKQHIM